MKTEEGIIFETEGNTARVKAGRHAECENCGACPGGGASIFTVRNDLKAHVGQRVLFEIQEEKSLRGAFMIFVLPIAAVFIGVWLGGLLCALLPAPVLLGQILGGVILLALSILLIRRVDKKHGGAVGMPRIVKVID